MVKLIITFFLIFFLASCNTSKGLDNNEKEYILTKVNNYQGLIQFYREQLSKEDTPDVRFKLCETYNKVNDIPSSQSCLHELLNNAPTDKSYLLAARNYLVLEDDDSALLMVTEALKKEPRNGEAYNIRGEILARKGNYDDAKRDFEKARELFVAEELVNNNLAMLAILQQDYSLAYSYLMPLYSRGYNSPQILHNLIFVLIKRGDYVTADSLMRQNSLDESTGELISRLADVNPVLGARDKNIVPNGEEKASKEKDIKLLKANDITRPEKISSETENASVPGTQNEITNILIGDHGKFVRFVFISPHPLKGSTVRGDKDNHASLTIFDTRNNKKISSVVSNIRKFTSSINSISISEVDGTLVLDFDTRRQIKRVRVYNTALSTVSTNKLVLDIIYN
ncbi:tetratricopeptide repeat protein [Salmonella enterica subsp. salamae]|uniref:tetratricopeptide repeat protein n=1 Tax=Salmonella sp. NW826 TaxID=2948311 RepID=UPI0012857697|nr:tetratricopeptide repeat protein [Salmonella enterica subsp. salamae]